MYRRSAGSRYMRSVEAIGGTASSFSVRALSVYTYHVLQLYIQRADTRTTTKKVGYEWSTSITLSWPNATSAVENVVRCRRQLIAGALRRRAVVRQCALRTDKAHSLHPKQV